MIRLLGNLCIHICICSLKTSLFVGYQVLCKSLRSKENSHILHFLCCIKRNVLLSKINFKVHFGDLTILKSECNPSTHLFVCLFIYFFIHRNRTRGLTHNKQKLYLGVILLAIEYFLINDINLIGHLNFHKGHRMTHFVTDVLDLVGNTCTMLNWHQTSIHIIS